MVEDYVTDGERIAELLASELTGLDHGPGAKISAADARPDAAPTPSGTQAFTVEYGAAPVARVVLFPDAVEVVADGVDASAVENATRGAGLETEGSDGSAVLRIETGAAVKRAVDALVAGLEERAGDGQDPNPL